MPDHLVKKTKEERVEYFEGPGPRERYRRITFDDGKFKWEVLNRAYNKYQPAFREVSEMQLELEYQEKYA